MLQKNTNLSAFMSEVRDINEDLMAALEFIEWREHIKRDSVVFVKPNFTYPYYKEGITTSPDLLRSLLRILKNRAERVIVGESDGGNHSFSADTSFEGHCMPQLCREYGAELLNLSKSPSSIIEDRIADKKVRVRLPNILTDQIDCCISVPVLKVHVMTGVSLTLKNLWGCNPNPMRCLEHKNLDYKLALIAKHIGPVIGIIDGKYALDYHGPMYGTPVRKDLLIASNNPVVCDTLGSSIMGIPLVDANHILIAEKAGLGPTGLKGIRANQDWHQYAMNLKIDRTILDRASVLLFNSRFLAKVAMDSPLSPMIYGVAGILRNQSEREVAEDLKKYNP